MYCTDAVGWKPAADKKEEKKPAIFEYRPLSAAVQDPSKTTANISFGSCQTIYPYAASVLLGVMPKGTVYADHVDVVHALVRGLYDEHTSIDGPVLMFDEPIQHEDMRRQKGTVLNLFSDKGLQRLYFHCRTTIEGYLTKERATLARFVPAPFTNNGYRVKQTSFKQVVLLQGSTEEQQQLAAMVNDFCRTRKGHEYLVAGITHTITEFFWYPMRGLIEDEPDTDKRKLTPVDSTEDDEYIYAGF